MVAVAGGFGPLLEKHVRQKLDAFSFAWKRCVEMPGRKGPWAGQGPRTEPGRLLVGGVSRLPCMRRQSDL